MKQSITLLKAWFLAIVLFIGGTTAFAQTPSVNITVNILPPYSPYYSDYSGPNAGKVLLTVQNLSATPRSIKLAGQLTGDNGIKLSTKSNYVPPTPITLNPNEIKQLNGFALQNIFDVNTLNVYGIDKSKLVYTSRLPEGNYTFCIQALDYNNGQPLSAQAPLGCTQITISYPEAPVLVSPAVNAQTESPTIQNLNFNWINAGFVPAGTQYLLQIVEMPPLVPADPNQVMKAASFPLISKTVMGTSVNLSPSDPPLKQGRRYAWRVKAFDPTGKVVFKNDGVSNAQQFRYGPEIKTPSVVTLQDPKANMLITKLADLKFKWTFTDNSAKNDQVNLGSELMSINKNFNFSSNKYTLYVVKVKTDEEKKAESKSNMALANMSANNNGAIKDLGFAVETSDLNFSGNNSTALQAYLQNNRTYEWYVKHNGSGVTSEKRVFNYKLPQVTPPYNLLVKGNLKYNFYNKETGANATNKAGFALSGRILQLLKIAMLVPMGQMAEKVTVVENGQTVTKTEISKKINAVNTLKNYPLGQPNLANNYPIVASTMTDEFGGFEFNVNINQADYKVLDSNIVLNGKQYAAVEALVVRVADTRFSDPNWLIYPDKANNNLVLEPEKIQAFDWKLNVRFKTDAQRNYVGTLYLMRDDNRRIPGEVDGMPGIQKEITSISGVQGAFNYAKSRYTIVGQKKINGMSDITGVFQTTFSDLVISNSMADNYVVFFEPDAQQDALYFYPLKTSNIKTYKYTFLPTLFNKYNTEQTVEFGPKYLSMRIAGRYMYKWKNPHGKENPTLPIPEGTKISLVKGYLTQKDFFKDGTELAEQKILMTTTVKKNGEYAFDLGMIDYNDFNKDAKSLVIMVESKYYTSQPYSVLYNQKENVQVPDLTAFVKQYTFQSKLAYGLNVMQKVVPGMNVYLCRPVGAKFVGQPVNEGDPQKDTYFKKIWDHPNGEKFQIIDRTTSDLGGQFTFNRLVVPSETADQYYIFAEPMSNSPDNYLTLDKFSVVGALQTASIFGIAYLPEAKMHFTDEYVVSTKAFIAGSLAVPVVPLDPYIDGAVYPYSNTAANVLSGVNVELFNMINVPAAASDADIEKYLSGKSAVQNVITGSNGRFLFQDFAYAQSTGWKLLRLTKNGFLVTYYKVNGGNYLVKGKRGNTQNIYMELPKQLSTFIVDTDNQPVPARVIVGNDFSWSDSYIFPGKGEHIALKTPVGQVKFTIIPNDQSKYKVTEITRTIAKNTYNLDNFVVKKSEHVIGVIVNDISTGKALKADVTVTNVNAVVKKDSYEMFGGYINTVIFSGPGTQFDLRVVPVGNYTIAKTRVYNSVDEQTVVVVDVQPAVSLSFTARILSGTNRYTPTKEFDVYVKGRDNDEFIFENTVSGKVIRRVPANIMGFTVVGTKQGYLSKEQNYWIAGNTPAAEVITFTAAPVDVKDFFGYPVELSKVTQVGTTYLLNGRVNITGKTYSTHIKVAEKDKWVEFKNASYTAVTTTFNGKSTTTTKLNGPIKLEATEVDATVFNVYKSKIMDKGGLQIVNDGSKASVKGYVGIDPGSFAGGAVSSVDEAGGDMAYLYINDPGVNYATITQNMGNNKTYTTWLETTTTKDIGSPQKDFVVSTERRYRPFFDFVGDFTVTADNKVMMGVQGINFDGTVVTSLENVASGNIGAKAKFLISYTNATTQNEQPFSVKLNQWTLDVKFWQLSKAGFTTNGSLNALGLTIPFNKLKFTNYKIGFGEFTVSGLKLLNSFPVTFKQGEVMTSFGFDKGFSAAKGAWSVAILADNIKGALAGIKGLPDLNANDEIQIRNINLYDTGDAYDTRVQLMEEHPAVTLNGIAKYYPNQVFGGSNFITFQGGLSLDVPNLQGLENVNYELRYQVVNNQFTHIHEKPFKGLTLKTKGISVLFTDKDQVFSNGQLALNGILEDIDTKSLYEIPVRLVKTASYTTMGIPTDKGVQQVYLAGKNSETYLDKATGSMSVSNGVWGDFVFEGDMTGANGIKPEDSHLVFTIKGDLVANSSEIGVKNMDAGGMKGINITYDFANNALVGSGHLNQVTNWAVVDMDIDFKVSPSSWYIFTNAMAYEIKNTPFSQMAMGMIIGNTTLTADQKASLGKHFKNGEPTANWEAKSSSVQGILTIFSVDFPIPIIPTFDIPLDPIAHASLKHGVYGNVYMKATFSTNPDDLALDVGARVGAFVKVGVGASIGLACASISLGADLHFDAEGSIQPFLKKFSMDLGTQLTLEGSAYVGAGICNSSCETPCVDAGFFEICSPIPCVKVGLSKKLVLGLKAGVSEKGFSFESIKIVN